jgi:hypothetical protein
MAARLLRAVNKTPPLFLSLVLVSNDHINHYIELPSLIVAAAAAAATAAAAAALLLRRWMRNGFSIRRRRWSYWGRKEGRRKMARNDYVDDAQ